jgi:hypothetical protein
MNGRAFDHVVQALGRNVSRRGVLGVLAGATGLGAREGAAKRRRSGHRTKAKKPTKVTVCHASGGTYQPLEVNNNVVTNHLTNHGDFLYGDCCTDADCAASATCVIGGGTSPTGWCEFALAPPDASSSGPNQPPDGVFETPPEPASAGTCTAGQDYCRTLGPYGPDTCNGNRYCGCATSTSGKTLCGYYLGSVCYPCERDADCTEVTGPGSFCAVVYDSTQLVCPCQDSNNRSCAPPCPDEADEGMVMAPVFTEVGTGLEVPNG